MKSIMVAIATWNNLPYNLFICQDVIEPNIKVRRWYPEKDLVLKKCIEDNVNFKLDTETRTTYVYVIALSAWKYKHY